MSYLSISQMTDGNVAEGPHEYWRVPMMRWFGGVRACKVNPRTDESELYALSDLFNLERDHSKVDAMRKEFEFEDWPEESRWQFWIIYAVLLNACPRGSNDVPTNFPNLPSARTKQIVKWVTVKHKLDEDHIRKEARKIVPVVKASTTVRMEPAREPSQEALSKRPALEIAPEEALSKKRCTSAITQELPSTTTQEPSPPPRRYPLT